MTTAAICGIEARRVSVEADISSGLPCFVMVGFLGSEVKEAQDRVRTALVNSGFRMPSARVTVSLSPADLRKSGSWFDLPIAVAVLGAMGVVPAVMDEIMMAGELGLTGSVRPVRGIMEMVCRSADFGCRSCIIPLENLDEGACIPGRQVICPAVLTDFPFALKNIEQAVLFHDLIPRKGRPGVYAGAA